MKKLIIISFLLLIWQICFAINIREIPFENVRWDTHLSTSFNPTNKVTWSTVRRDVMFLESWVLKIIEVIKWIIWTVAVIFGTYSWLKILLAYWKEDTIKNEIRQLRWIIICLMLIFLVDPFVRGIFFGWWSWIQPWEAIFSEKAMKTWVLEIEWVISYIQTFVGLMAVFVIITQWIKMIFSDKDDALKNQKQTMNWILIWMILIFLNKAFIYYWILWNPVTWEERSLYKTITELSAAVKYFLWFLLVISLCILVYWWFLLITAKWDWDMITSWRNIMIDVLLWMFVISISYVIVSTIVLSWWW